MSEDFSYQSVSEHDDSAAESLDGWLRWWHWLILVGLFLGAILWFPLWRFERRWTQLRVGDPMDRVSALLGNPGTPAYTVQGPGVNGVQQAYVYRFYWRQYEVFVSQGTHRVVGKNVLDKDGTPIQSE